MEIDKGQCAKWCGENKQENVKEIARRRKKKSV